MKIRDRQRQPQRSPQGWPRLSRAALQFDSCFHPILLPPLLLIGNDPKEHHLEPPILSQGLIPKTPTCTTKGGFSKPQKGGSYKTKTGFRSQKASTGPLTHPLSTSVLGKPGHLVDLDMEIKTSLTRRVQSRQ